MEACDGASYDYVGTLTQAGRLLAIETPIGPGCLPARGDGWRGGSLRPLLVPAPRPLETPGCDPGGDGRPADLLDAGTAGRRQAGMVRRGRCARGRPHAGRRHARLYRHRPSLALAVRAHLRLPHFPAQDDAADPRDDLRGGEDPRLRFRAGDRREGGARILRPVQRDRPGLHLPPAGGGGLGLVVPARARRRRGAGAACAGGRGRGPCLDGGRRAGDPLRHDQCRSEQRHGLDPPLQLPAGTAGRGRLEFRGTAGAADAGPALARAGQREQALRALSMGRPLHRSRPREPGDQAADRGA